MSASGTYRLLCLENPLLDIQAFGDESLLQKYGLKSNDAILIEQSSSANIKDIYNDLITNHKATLQAGGAAQNTARGAQYILADDSTVFVGGAGDDKYAATLKEAAAKAGLRVEYRVDPANATGRCAVVCVGHDRSMCTDLGAANHYGLDHLKKPEIWDLVKAAQVYFVGGYHFTVCPPAIMALAEEAAAADKQLMLSLSAPFIPLAFKAPLDEAMPYVDHVVGNESEAAAFGQSQGLAEGTDLKEVARHIAELPKKNAGRKRVVIVTQGKLPAIVAVQGEKEIREFPIHALDAANIVDTTGAGDAFAAGYVAGVVDGKSLEQSVDQGMWLARLSIQELGPAFPFPKQSYPGRA